MKKQATKKSPAKTNPAQPKNNAKGPKTKGRVIYKSVLDSPSMPSNMSECTAEYAASLANPFADGPDGACIPDTPALMTRLTKVWSRGTFSTSTNALALGVGWIVIDPFSAFAQDRIFVYTNAAGANTPNIDFLTAGQFNSFNSNSEYLTAQLSPQGCQARVVSAGVKINNITSQLQRGGFLLGLHEPAHLSFQGADISSIDAYLESKRLPADSREWSVLTYRPIETTDLDFQTAFVIPGAGVIDTCYMAFMVQAPDSTGANPQLYEYEAFVNFEIQGAKVIGKTASHADPVGYAAVNAMTVFANKLHSPHQDSPKDVASAFIQGVSHYLGHHMSKPTPAPEQKNKESVWSNIIDALPSVLGAVMSVL